MVDALFEKVRAVVSRHLEMEPDKLLPETTFEEIEADSLDVVEIVMALEEKFDIEIPDEQIENVKSLQEIVEVIRGLAK